MTDNFKFKHLVELLDTYTLFNKKQLGNKCELVFDGHITQLEPKN